MATEALGINGFELGQLPATGDPNIGYLTPSSGFATADFKLGSARTGSFGYNSKVTVAARAAGAAIQPLTANTSLGSSWFDIRGRFFFRPITFPSLTDMNIGFLRSGTNACELYLQMNTSGQLRASPVLCGNTNTAYTGTLTLGNWYRVEMHIFGDISLGLNHVDATNYIIKVYNDQIFTPFITFSENHTPGNNLPVNFPGLFTVGQDSASGPICTREI